MLCLTNVDGGDKAHGDYVNVGYECGDGDVGVTEMHGPPLGGILGIPDLFGWRCWISVMV